MHPGKLVHTRKIEIRSFDLGDHRILVEGELEDTRRPPSEDRSDAESFLVHHLIARMWVQGPDLTVSAIDAEMKQTPRQGCPEALPWIQKLIGLKIITGFTQKVKDLIGSVRGCSHLTNLFLTLGPVAVQGYWAAYGRRPETRSLANPAISRVINSCHLWREDGPHVKSLLAAAEKQKRGF